MVTILEIMTVINILNRKVPNIFLVVDFCGFSFAKNARYVHICRRTFPSSPSSQRTSETPDLLFLNFGSSKDSIMSLFMCLRMTACMARVFLLPVCKYPTMSAKQFERFQKILVDYGGKYLN